MAEAWTHVTGVDLEDAFRGGTLPNELPAVQAVYMWKWSLRALDYQIADPESALAWIRAMASCPAGRVTPTRVNHFFMINAAQLGGVGLPESKVTVLRSFLQKPANLRWLRRYLQQLANHAPALYVGETGDLPSRTRSHMAAETNFGDFVATSPHLSWSQLDFYYCPLGPATDQPSQVRKSIEYLTAIITFAGFTARPG